MRTLKSFKPLLILALFTLVFTVACGGGSSEYGEPEETTPAEPETPADAPMEPTTATAELHGQEGSAIHGTVVFSQAPDGGPVSVQAEVEGVEATGLHGFHIHAIGDCSAADFTSAGCHFNPTGAPHGGPDDAEHHAGDLGNIEIGDDGTGTLNLSSDSITLADGAANSVIGKAVIVHAGEDDLETQPTGDAGARLACGVIQASMM
jgi:Cu-Zn family superoxide dismutase